MTEKGAPRAGVAAGRCWPCTALAQHPAGAELPPAQPHGRKGKAGRGGSGPKRPFLVLWGRAGGTGSPAHLDAGLGRSRGQRDLVELRPHCWGQKGAPRIACGCSLPAPSALLIALIALIAGAHGPLLDAEHTAGAAASTGGSTQSAPRWDSWAP